MTRVAPPRLPVLARSLMTQPASNSTSSHPRSASSDAAPHTWAAISSARSREIIGHDLSVWVEEASANFSWAAEYGNVEFGVLVDNQNLTESVEREMREAEDLLFERIAG
jgi:hypothetical protein